MATPRSATPTPPSVAAAPDGRLVLDADDLRDGARRASSRASAGPSTRRSTTSAASPRPSARPRRRTPIAPGIEIERRWTPLARVGAYVPGGSAPYPSSLVMTVVPAQVAGVERDRRRLAGRPRRRRRTPSCSARPACSRSMRFIVAGGAQAIGALAYGLPGRRPRAGRPDRRPGQRLGHRGQDRGLRRGRHRPAGRAVGGDGPRRAAGRPACASRPTSSPRPSTAPTPRRSSSRPTPPSPTPSRARSPPSSPAPPARAILAARACATTAGSSSPRPSTPPSTSSTPTPRSTCRSTSSRSSRPSRGSRNAGSLFVGPWAPESAGDYATGANHVLPTGGLARASGALVGRDLRQVQSRSSASTARASPASARRSRPWPRPRACSPTATPSRSASQEPEPMSPTPVTFSSPTAPAVYTWEATDEEVAARYGVDPATIVRFDLNTSPGPAGRWSTRLLAAGRFDAPLSEYPPTDYRRADRGRRRALRRRPRPSSSSAPARTRSSTSSPRRSSRPAAAPSSRPRPTRCTAS